MPIVQQTNANYTEKQRLMDYRATFGSEHGQRVLHDLMGRYWMLMPLSAKSVIVDSVLFREGQRCVVLDILQVLATKPAELIQRRERILEQFGFEEIAES